MKIQKKAVFSSVLTILILMVFYTYSYAGVQLPEKVRIGLFYETSAASSINISATKGIQMGYFKDGIFTSIAEEPTNNNVLIRKDAYYTKNNTAYTEYKLTGQAIPSSGIIGPYHIQIGAPQFCSKF